MVDWKAATLWSLIIWSLLFTITAIIRSTNLNFNSRLLILSTIWLVLVWFGMYMYFRENKISTKDSLLLGIYFYLISTSLDLITTLISQQYQSFSPFRDYFINYYYWVTLALTLSTCWLYSSFNTQKALDNKKIEDMSKTK